MNFDADEVTVRLCVGQCRQMFTIAKADFQHPWGLPVEQRIKV